jgi:hypothetical protein
LRVDGRKYAREFLGKNEEKIDFWIDGMVGRPFGEIGGKWEEFFKTLLVLIGVKRLV